MEALSASAKRRGFAVVKGKKLHLIRAKKDYGYGSSNVNRFQRLKLEGWLMLFPISIDVGWGTIRMIGQNKLATKRLWGTELQSNAQEGKWQWCPSSSSTIFFVTLAMASLEPALPNLYTVDLLFDFLHSGASVQTWCFVKHFWHVQLAVVLILVIVLPNWWPELPKENKTKNLNWADTPECKSLGFSGK